MAGAESPALLIKGSGDTIILKALKNIIVAIAALLIMSGSSSGLVAEVVAPVPALLLWTGSPTPPLPTSGQPISQAEWDAATHRASPSGPGVDGSSTSSVNWSYLPTVGLNSFGVPGRVDATMISHLLALNIKLVRYYLSWSVTVHGNPASTSYDWNGVDQDLAALRANGIYSQILVSGCPGGACVPNPYDGGENGPLLATYYNQFVAFYSAAMQRYANAVYLAYAWEMFNEPDTRWSGDAPDKHTYTEHYVADLATFYVQLHSICASCIAMNGGLAQDRTPAADVWLIGQSNDHTGSALWWGMGNYSDALNFHYYHGDQYNAANNPYGTNILDAAARQRVHLGYFTLGSLPLVVNESGSDAVWNGWTQEKQARYLLYNLAQGMSAGIKSVNLFEYVDNPALSRSGYGASGLVNTSFQPKTAYTIVSRYNLEIGPQPYIGAPSGLPSNVAAYSFQSNRVAGVTTWLVWTTDGSSGPVSIYDPSAKIRSAADMYGNPITWTRSGSNTVVQVQSNPVYLRWNP